MLIKGTLIPLKIYFFNLIKTNIQEKNSSKENHIYIYMGL